MTQQSAEGRASSKSSEHGTPDELYLPLHKEFNFTFDLAADPRNTKVPGKFFTKEDNALTKDWPTEGFNFLNPPYSRSVWRWIDKALDESVKGASTLVVINANVEQEWYHEVAVPYAQDIRFIEQRVKFIDWEAIWKGEKELDYERTGAFHPSLLLIFKAREALTVINKRAIVRIADPEFPKYKLTSFYAID